MDNTHFDGSRRTAWTTILLTLLLAGACAGSLKPAAPRRVLSLDGQWQIAQGAMDVQPAQFDRTVPVPGLVDMVRPGFAEVGRKSALRQAFWYRRTFKLDGPVPARAVLKIHKAMYGTRVLLNGQLAGEHVPCFTPAYLDVSRHLRGDGVENELIVRVGADRESLPAGVPGGWDFEKLLYTPGIYDSVELILTGEPYIVNVQTVPDLEKNSVRVVAEIEGAADGDVVAEVVESRSGKAAGAAKTVLKSKVDFTIPIAGARLWTPEDPFLYTLTLRTPGDAASVRFGMRTFSLDAATMRAMLNGKPYYLRGTNVTLLRFFEDAQRGDKPWRAEWVRRLHQKYKTMHWNSIRYCIGFAPEIWYDIADEEGLLIQDEFPIWIGNRKLAERLTAEQIIPQYVEWMRERWNHPCVVIWDAQNESVDDTNETGKAIAAVRQLDLSDRPWDNGWSPPQDPAKDSTELHPYRFNRTFRTEGKNPFRLSQLPTTTDPKPTLFPAQKTYGAAIIINEYDWLWLTREGEPTTLTQHVYASLLPKDATADQRRQVRARYVAALTEFWRAHRKCAGVLHFCGLGYSRPGDKPVPQGGATSDDFVDVEKLTFEPHFERYVRAAFNPVGVMLDLWDEQVSAGATREVRIYLTNDLARDFKGEVRLRVMQDDRVVSEQSMPCNVAALESGIVKASLTFPAQAGRHAVVAELNGAGADKVVSERQLEIVAPVPAAAR